MGLQTPYLVKAGLTWYNVFRHFFFDFNFWRLQFLGRTVSEVLDLFVQREQVPEELVVHVGEREELPP